MSSLCQISRVKHLFPKDVRLIITNALVFSKLFHCSTVWSGTTKQNIKKLQLIQNFAALILTGVRKYDSITQALKGLGRISVEKQLFLRNMAMIFKCVNGLEPSYLSQKISTRSQVHG